MLVDDFLPIDDVSDSVATVVRADAAPPPAAQAPAMRDTTEVPSSEGGWVLLGERPGDEIALGLVGKVWRPVIVYGRWFHRKTGASA